MQQAGVSKIEITSEMIEAGASVLRDQFDAGHVSARWAARDVFEVMCEFAGLGVGEGE